MLQENLERLTDDKNVNVRGMLQSSFKTIDNKSRFGKASINLNPSLKDRYRASKLVATDDSLIEKLMNFDMV
jgi:hypothetical protein